MEGGGGTAKAATAGQRRWEELLLDAAAAVGDWMKVHTKGGVGGVCIRN
jgi:hypothetical protein